MYQEEYDTFCKIHNSIPLITDVVTRLLGKMSTEKEDTSEMTIGFWGPPNSGKTWLLKAFLRQCELSLHSPHLEIKLLHRQEFSAEKISNPGSSSGTALVKEPTQPSNGVMEDYYYIMKRKFNGNSSTKGVNSHIHRIFTRDDMGKIFQGEPNDDDADVRRDNIAARDFIVIALDVNRTTRGKINSLDVENMIVGLKDLSFYLSTHKEKIKKISFCLTKADEFPIFASYYESKNFDVLSNKSFVIGLITDRFGDTTQKLKKVLEEIEGYKHVSVRYFAVSSCGYSVNGKPNIVSQGNASKPLHPSIWEPINVDNVFFWYFDEVEKKRILPEPDSLYARAESLAFIPPNFRDWLKKSNIMEVYQRRLREHIGYFG
jgi:hypothetical protein